MVSVDKGGCYDYFNDYLFLDRLFSVALFNDFYLWFGIDSEYAIRYAITNHLGNHDAGRILLYDFSILLV